MKLRHLIVAALALACGGPGTMKVDRKPIADFKFTQSTVRPQVFVFDAAASRPTVGTLAKYKWLFGDEPGGAAPTELTSSTAQHAYKTAGTFTVTLVVADDKDTNSEAVSKTVMVATVNNEGPMAKITGPTSGQPAMMLTFDGSTSTPSGDIQNFEWDYGDSTAKESGKDKSIVQHAFSANGQFTVTLTVTDSLGIKNTGELKVAIGNVGPLAVCSWSPSTVTVGTMVRFDGSASSAPGGLAVYLWDFGDGVNNQSGMTRDHAYANMGTFKPKLTVYDNSTPRKTHTADCPDVVVGAAPLCTGQYSWMPVGMNICGWSGTTIMVTQNANGTMTIVEPRGASSITYSGTWSGATFSLIGNDNGVDVDITGTFSGCQSWTGVYNASLGGFDCPTNISSMKL